MSTTFIKADNGDLINVASITKLHLDYLETDSEEATGIFADRIYIGAVSPEVNLQSQLNDLGARMATRPGVYSLAKDGSINHRFLDNDSGHFRTLNYPAGQRPPATGPR